MFPPRLISRNLKTTSSASQDDLTEGRDQIATLSGKLTRVHGKPSIEKKCFTYCLNWQIEHASQISFNVFFYGACVRHLVIYGHGRHGTAHRGTPRNMCKTASPSLMDATWPLSVIHLSLDVVETTKGLC